MRQVLREVNLEDGIHPKVARSEELRNKCVSIDLEIDPKTNRIQSFAGVRQNDSLEQARTISVEAEQEFREVYNMLGSSLTPSEILKKIESEFGPSAKTIAERERQQIERMKMVLVFCGAALLFLMVIFSAFQ